MSEKKPLENLVQLIFADFRMDNDTTRALRRLNILQINLARRMQFKEVKLVGKLKPFFKKEKGGVKQDG